MVLSAYSVDKIQICSEDPSDDYPESTFILFIYLLNLTQVP